MFSWHLTFWLVRKASNVPLSTRKEFVYLRANAYCPGNCVYTDKLLGKRGVSQATERKPPGPLHYHDGHITRVDINEVLLADSESQAPL